MELIYVTFLVARTYSTGTYLLELVIQLLLLQIIYPGRNMISLYRV